MKIYKNRAFNKWAIKAKITDKLLIIAIDEIEKGLIDANLGGNIVKKRIAVSGKGKSGSVRTLLAYKFSKKVFFIYGFSKNKQGNIKTDELKALKHYAKLLLSYTDKELDCSVREGLLTEIKRNG